MELLFFALVFGAITIITIRENRKRRKRRESLHQESNGSWVWVNFDGTTERSQKRPDEPGGAWDGGSSGSDGGGGDGGGGGE